MIYLDLERNELLFCYSMRLCDKLLEAGCELLDIRENKKTGKLYWLFEKTEITAEVMKQFAKEKDYGRYNNEEMGSNPNGQ